MKTEAKLYDRPLLRGPARIAATIVLRTAHGPLGRLWMALHRGLIAALARYLGRQSGAAVYLRGSFADGDAVPGLSDIDLIVVAPDRERAERRWARPAPLLGPLVNVKAYGAAELPAVAAHTVFTSPGPIFGEARHFSLRTRPGLEGPTRDWRLLRGPDLRPAEPGAPDPCVAAWLELQCWWRYAVWAAANPDDRQVPYLCVKLVAQGARIWLFLAHGETISGRVAALRRGLELMPADEPALREALDLHASLHRSPRADLDGTLRWLVSISERLGKLVDARAAERPGTTVRLERSGEPRPGRVPLRDWRALVMAEPGPQEVVLADGDPRDARDLAAADRARPPQLLRADGVFFIPSSDLEGRPLTRGTLRIVQCGASDPVTTALLAGRDEARFPDIRGWRAADWARRAAAERGGSELLTGLEGGDPVLRIG
jgi:hypothetical protein